MVKITWIVARLFRVKEGFDIASIGVYVINKINITITNLDTLLLAAEEGKNITNTLLAVGGSLEEREEENKN